MSLATYYTHPCPIAQALVELGDQWTLLIVRDALFRGCSRFGEFQKSLGISRNLLAQRLTQLTEADILERVALPGSKRFAYLPTMKCRDLATVVLALAQWAEKWRDTQNIIHLEPLEAATRQPVTLAFIRQDTGQPVAPADIDVENRGRLPADRVLG